MLRISTQSGASLIEVLVSLMLVAVTMLGLLGVQLRSMGLQKDSLDRRNAAVLASDFAQRVAANFDGFRNGDYNGTMGIADNPPATLTGCTSATTCTNIEVATRDWEQFQVAVRNRLPAGVADVRLDALNNSLFVTVGWLDPKRVEDTALAGEQVDVDSDNIDDACEVLGITDTRYRCYVANVFP